MLVIVAGRSDKKARDLADRWAPWRAAVLTCADLSVRGWRHQLGSPDDSEVVIDGQAVATREITGVLVRLPTVLERELVEITREDRAYVAEEITAFLRSWLAGLRCPVLNPPTPIYLSGPGWRPEHSVHVAARLGIPVRPVKWRIELSAGLPKDGYGSTDVTMTVVGEGCVGPPDRTLAAQARRLARAARVDLLAVHYAETEAGLRLRSADPWADISSPEIADAILEYFLERGRC